MGVIFAQLRKSGSAPPPPPPPIPGGVIPGFDPSDRVLDRSDVAALAAKYWPASQVENAVNVSECESEGFHTGAHAWHGEDSRGLWQINVLAWPALAQYNLYDPDTNAKWAHYIWTVSGNSWHPWTCARILGIG